MQACADPDPVRLFRIDRSDFLGYNDPVGFSRKGEPLPMDILRCAVEQITCRSEENGSSFIKVRVKDRTDLVAVVGSMADIHS